MKTSWCLWIEFSGMPLHSLKPHSQSRWKMYGGHRNTLVCVGNTSIISLFYTSLFSHTLLLNQGRILQVHYIRLEWLQGSHSNFYVSPSLWNSCLLDVQSSPILPWIWQPFQFFLVNPSTLFLAVCSMENPDWLSCIYMYGIRLHRNVSILKTTSVPSYACMTHSLTVSYVPHHPSFSSWGRDNSFKIPLLLSHMDMSPYLSVLSAVVVPVLQFTWITFPEALMYLR